MVAELVFPLVASREYLMAALMVYQLESQLDKKKVFRSVV
jgi:hypothetical protein